MTSQWGREELENALGCKVGRQETNQQPFSCCLTVSCMGQVPIACRVTV